MSTSDIIEKKDKVVEGNITLISKDGQSFILPKIHAYLSNLVKCTSEQDNTSTQIELSIEGEVLTRIVEYLTHHKGISPEEIKKPLRSLDMSKIVVDQWDATFINSLVQSDLFNVILAANYMDIRPLLNLGCAKIASCIKGKTNEEIKAIFQDGKAGFVPTVVVAGSAMPCEEKM